MKKIAILTSGGDAPGMNAAIRAVVRSSLEKEWEPWGVRNGFAGLIGGNFITLGSRDVGGIIQCGGTMLGSSRCPEFKNEDSQIQALKRLEEFQIDFLVVIGGNGSQAGALALWEKKFPVVGIASTIDNDLFGSEISIGVDTALNVALEAMDRLKVTASSHHRAFLLEVMGRNSGYLALMAGIAGGAEVVIVPEVMTEPSTVAEELQTAYRLGKAHALAVVAEGSPLNAAILARYFQEHREKFGFDLRITSLGHVQRGGSPGAFDRLLATRLGVSATQSLFRGEYGVLLGWQKGDVAATSLKEAVTLQKSLDPEIFKLAKMLAI